MAEAKTFEMRLRDVIARLRVAKSNFNSFGKYSYRSCEDILEAVKPLLEENELRMTISDEVVLVGNRYYVKATVTVRDGRDVYQSVSAFARESEDKKGMDDSQITGSTSSYARKYALNGMFCIDDNKDADTNEHREQVKNTPAPKAEVHPPTEDQLQTLKGLAMQAGYTKEERDEKLAAVTTYQIAEQSITNLRERVAQKRQQNAVAAAVTPDNVQS